MASDTHAGVRRSGAAPGSSPASASGCRMTRCECAELPFEEIARRVEDEGLAVADALRRGGCGQICTACLPDLESYLKAL
jgi:hypothetical protein